MEQQLTSLAEFLQLYGGWGLSVILMVGIVYLYRSFSVLLERRNEQFIEVLKETTAMLQQNADASRRTEAVLQRVEDKLNSK